MSDQGWRLSREEMGFRIPPGSVGVAAGWVSPPPGCWAKPGVALGCSEGWVSGLAEGVVGEGGEPGDRAGEGEGESGSPDICMERKYLVAAWRSCSRSSAVCRLQTILELDL